MGAGFTAAWSATHLGELGNTWGHAPDLKNTTVNLTRRLDLVLFCGGLCAFDADIVGEELTDRTPSGLWPSDHAGIVATLGLQPAAHRRSGQEGECTLKRSGKGSFGCNSRRLEDFLYQP